MNNEIKKKIEEEAIIRYSDIRTTLAEPRYDFIRGCEYGYSLQQSVNSELLDRLQDMVNVFDPEKEHEHGEIGYENDKIYVVKKAKEAIQSASQVNEKESDVVEQAICEHPEHELRNYNDIYIMCNKCDCIVKNLGGLNN